MEISKSTADNSLADVETTPLLASPSSPSPSSSSSSPFTSSSPIVPSNTSKHTTMDSLLSGASYNHPTNVSSQYSSPPPKIIAGIDPVSNQTTPNSSTANLLSSTASLAAQRAGSLRSSHVPSPLAIKQTRQQQQQQQQQQAYGHHRIGPQRTSYTTQKLKLLPENVPEEEDEESGREVYSQVTRIKDTPARKDAERLGKAHRSVLPRVTAYCTASSYRMKEITRYLNSRRQYKAAPKLFDECLYTPYTYKRDDKTGGGGGAYNLSANSSSGTVVASSTTSSSTSPTSSSYTERLNGLMRLDDEGGEIDVELTGHSDVFLFEYGVAVFWGFSEAEERRFLKELARFENEKLADEDVQVEEFNYYITKSYQPRIYNDFITLRDGTNYMIKLSISHALAQSVKISLFEELVDNTIEDTQDFPQEVAVTGKISMSRKDIMKSIGELFILRINVNLHGSVLDSPELMWSEPHLEPIYQAARGYLEITQRVTLLNQRLEVISDLLQMLKEQMGYAHGEYLEFIVIVLIAVEILVAIVNVVVDYYASRP
ncbi:uncharacterized protein SAPINGB_P006095 [Magnusiomyces paraingens]|uniref:DUF155 domain-containing protein n=1 Tax=Magnusiomyces paraingens TaxID=2606893 RepID=A0A5E8CAD7_9ASCO|nr:uncharacterized protein SAPINGB_P006095 [Saprochaete ingens]VVT58216.1 unnamed protein product [Saprochaete ingens]